MQRVAILGPGGSGKTTLAVALGERTGLPVVHLDRLFWKPGWVESEREAFRARQADALAGDRWIADGNYSATIEVRLTRADTVVLLDFPTWRTIPRVLRRWVRNRGRETQAEGCPECFDLPFYRWVANYRRRSRPIVLAAIDEHCRDADVHVLRSPRAVRRFLASVD